MEINKNWWPIIYARLSRSEAKSEGPKKLNKQVKVMKTWLKKNGFKKEPIVFKEVASGSDPTRKEWNAAIKAAIAKKKAVFVVTDWSRWAKNIRHGMAGSIPLYEAGIPLISTLEGGIQGAAGTKANPNADGDLLWAIKVALGAADIERLKGREIQVREELQSEDIATTAGLGLFPFAAMNPWAVLIEHYPRFKAKDIKGAAYGRLVADSTKVKGRKVSPGDQWYKRNYKNYVRIKEALTESEFKRWWEFLNRVRAYEKAEGYDGAGQGVEKGKVSWKVKALRRMSNAYLTEPEKYVEPTDEHWVEWTENFPSYLGVKDGKLYDRLG